MNKLLVEHFSSPSVFSGVRVTRSIVLCVCFVDRCLSFCPFSFGHCVVGSSSIYEFGLPPFGIFKLFLYNIRNTKKQNKINIFFILFICHLFFLSYTSTIVTRTSKQNVCYLSVNHNKINKVKDRHLIYYEDILFQNRT